MIYLKGVEGREERVARIMNLLETSSNCDLYDESESIADMLADMPVEFVELVGEHEDELRIRFCRPITASMAWDLAQEFISIEAIPEGEVYEITVWP